MHVTVDDVIGQRHHAVTGAHVVHLACGPSTDPTAEVVAPGEPVEVRWAELAEVELLMPDVYGPVREHLDQLVVNPEIVDRGSAARCGDPARSW